MNSIIDHLDYFSPVDKNSYLLLSRIIWFNNSFIYIKHFLFIGFQRNSLRYHNSRSGYRCKWIKILENGYNGTKIKRDVKRDTTVSFSKLDWRSSICRVSSFHLTNIIDSSDWNFNRVNAPPTTPSTSQTVTQFKDCGVEWRYRIERWEQNFWRITNSWDDDEAGTNRV